MQDSLTEMETFLANKHIEFNSMSKQFALKPSIHFDLSQERVLLVQKQISEVNKQILAATKDRSINVYAADQNNENILIKQTLLRKNGINSIKFYWNYDRIKLSGSTVRNTGNGLTLGGHLDSL